MWLANAQHLIAPEMPLIGKELSIDVASTSSAKSARETRPSSKLVSEPSQPKETIFDVMALSQAVLRSIQSFFVGNCAPSLDLAMAFFHAPGMTHAFSLELGHLPDDVTLVPLEAAHLDGAVALSGAVGWSHRHQDWAMLLPMSKGIAALNDGRVVGTAIRSDFGPGLSTLNMVIVEAGMRGHGLGHALVRTAIGEDQRGLRLIATRSGLPLYERLGFSVVGSITTLEGRTRQTGRSADVRDAAPLDISDITRLESKSFGGDRSALVDWFAKNARLAVIENRGEVVGYGAARAFARGFEIGPVVAPSTDAGHALIAHLAHDLHDQLIRLDVPNAGGLVNGLLDMGLKITHPAPIMQRAAESATQDRLAYASQALI